MKTSDADILIVPGYSNSGPEHWQTRWEAKLSTARRADLGDWEAPRFEPWIARLLAEVEQATRPVILVGHSLGVIAIAHAATLFPEQSVAGAFMVGLPDIDIVEMPAPIDRAFAPIPTTPLPFPSVLVASRTDPYCAFERAEQFAALWGSALSDAGDSGHIDTASGHGPWPEGLMRFAGFLKALN